MTNALAGHFDWQNQPYLKHLKLKGLQPKMQRLPDIGAARMRVEICDVRGNPDRRALVGGDADCPAPIHQ